MRVDDVRRIGLSTFVRPPEETGGAPRVEAVPLPTAPAWMDRLLAFDPRRVVFVHDAAAWEPPV